MQDDSTIRHAPLRIFNTIPRLSINRSKETLMSKFVYIIYDRIMIKKACKLQHVKWALYHYWQDSLGNDSAYVVWVLSYELKDITFPLCTKNEMHRIHFLHVLSKYLYQQYIMLQVLSKVQ